MCHSGGPIRAIPSNWSCLADRIRDSKNDLVLNLLRGLTAKLFFLLPVSTQLPPAAFDVFQRFVLRFWNKRKAKEKC